MTPHFTLDEVIHSDTAIRKMINNSLPPELMKNVLRAAQGMEEIRALLENKPISVNSWYRCEILNKAICGASKSDHMTGFAIDFTCKDFGSPLDIVKFLSKSNLQFDQMIQEGTWVHVSFAPAMRKEVLTAHFNGSGVSYTKGV